MAGRYASERTRFTVGEYRLRVVLREPLGGTKGLWRSPLAFAEQGRVTKINSWSIQYLPAFLSRF